MGTDIHMACEVKRNDKWELVTDKVFKNHWYEPNSEYRWAKEEYTNIPYDNRCYNLFAILAGVRNGRGFAGCKTGEEFNPISAPKGYPEDMCVYGNDRLVIYDGGNHIGRLSSYSRKLLKISGFGRYAATEIRGQHGGHPYKVLCLIVRERDGLYHLIDFLKRSRSKV